MISRNCLCANFSLTRSVSNLINSLTFLLPCFRFRRFVSRELTPSQLQPPPGRSILKMLPISISTVTMKDIVLPQFSSSNILIGTDSAPILPRFISNNDLDYHADQYLEPESRVLNSIVDITSVNRSSSAFQRITRAGIGSHIYCTHTPFDSSVHLPTFEQNDDGTTIHDIGDCNENDGFFLLSPDDLQRKTSSVLSSLSRISRKRTSPEAASSGAKLSRTMPIFRPKIFLRPKITFSSYTEIP